MTVSNFDYLERFLQDVDRILNGCPGAISDDRWLSNNYDPAKLDVLKPYLRFEDPRVSAELILVLTDVRERRVRKEIESLGRSSGDKVSMACLGYLTTIDEDDKAIPELFDILDHEHGQEFFRAARRMAGIAREEDIPHLRRIYGQVGGSMKDEIRIVIEKVIARNPGLEATRDLILSTPVYPNESEFERFLDSSIEYIDVRYRENIHPRKQIKFSTYNNVVRALRKMRTRLYNESDNLQYYGPDKDDRYHDLSSLLKWANEDLATKTVLEPESNARSRTCPRCGNMLMCYKGIWICPDCGGNL